MRKHLSVKTRILLNRKTVCLISSVQSLSSVWLFATPWTAQHARPPCPSPTPRADPNSCPLSRWCHPTISSSVIPFSSCPQSFPASRSFQMSQLFALGGQSTGISASTSVLPMNTQDWSPLGWTGWIFLQSKGLKVNVSLISKTATHKVNSITSCSGSMTETQTWKVEERKRNYLKLVKKKSTIIKSHSWKILHCLM